MATDGKNTDRLEICATCLHRLCEHNRWPCKCRKFRGSGTQNWSDARAAKKARNGWVFENHHWVKRTGGRP